MMKGENMYQLTKEGEKNVSEFVEECRKRYKKISEYYTDCDHVELPTREIILDEINSGESLHCNCVHAHAGSQLLNDEIIFYNESAMLLNYIVEFK